MAKNDMACPLCGELKLGPMLPVMGRLLCYDCGLHYQSLRGWRKLTTWLTILRRGKAILRMGRDG